MSAAVEASHRSHFSPLLDTMARPGNGWGHDPYAPRHGGYYQDPQHPQGQQSQNDRLPGPSSLFSPHAAHSPSPLGPAGPAPSHQYPASPPGRDVHYSGGHRPACYSGDYTTPSPITQTPPLLPQAMGEQPQHPLPPAARRHPDARLSPAQSSTTSDRSDELPPEAFRGHGTHLYQAAAPPARTQLVQQAPAQLPILGKPIADSVRRTLAQPDEPRHPVVSGPLMGKLVPQSYSANGRQPRSAAPPTPNVDTHPSQQAPPPPSPAHQHISNRPSQQQAKRLPAYQVMQQQFQVNQPQQSYSPSPPPVANGYLPHQEQQQQQQQQQQPHQNSVSPRQDPLKMSINNLLSGGGGGSSDSKNVTTQKGAASSSRRETTSALPSPSPASQKAVATSEYRIQVRQQPVAARSCGFGERDRRVIDPPPIVQLFYDDPNASPDDVSARIRQPFSVVHCSIWNETGEQDNSAMPEDYRQQRRLMGTLVASPFVGLDEKGEEGCFFCFPDLSCRTPGSFRLKFSLVIICPKSTQLGSKAPILATTMSEVFTVYNAKDFPGMQASTPLTKRLKEQGCLISIKKGNERGPGGAGGGSGGGGGNSRDRDESDDDDDDDAAGGGGGPSGVGSAATVGRRKRQRKT